MTEFELRVAIYNETREIVEDAVEERATRAMRRFLITMAAETYDLDGGE